MGFFGREFHWGPLQVRDKSPVAQTLPSGLEDQNSLPDCVNELDQKRRVILEDQAAM